MKNNYNTGFSLAEVLVTMIIIGVLSIAAAPFITQKRITEGYEFNTVKCIKDQYAVDLNSTACANSINYCKHNTMQACKALMHYADHGSTLEQSSARKVLREVCDNGGEKACEYLVKSCMKDSSVCDITSSDYDLAYYLRLAQSDATLGRLEARDLTKSLYKLENTNIVTVVEDICCKPDLNTACDVMNIIECPWIYQYGGDDGDKARAMTIDGDYIYIGAQEKSDPTGGGTDLALMKLNLSDGTVDWKKQWGWDGGTKGTECRAVAVSGDYLYAAGMDNQDGTCGGDDIFVIKVNKSDGSTVWKYQYGGSDKQKAFGMTVGSDGYIYVTGHDYDCTGGTSADMFVMKLDTDGYVQWKYHYGNQGVYDAGYSIVESGGKLYIAASFNGFKLGLAKLDTDGNVEWANKYNNNLSLYDLVVSGNYIYATGNMNYDVVVMKVNESDGSVVWANAYGGDDADTGESIKLEDNYLYVTGRIDDSWTTEESGTDYIHVMKLNESDGSRVWINRYGGSQTEQARALELNGDHIYVTGWESSDTDGGDVDIVLLRFRKDITTSNIDEIWDKEGETLDTEPLTPTVIDLLSVWDINKVTIADGCGSDPCWVCEGTVLGDTDENINAWDSVNGEDIDGWTLEGTILDDEVIDEWDYSPN